MKYTDFINSNKYIHEYDEIISFGFNCNTATALDRIGIRKKSYPLDWVRFVEETSNAELGFCGRIALICAKFKDFINKSNLYVAYDNQDKPQEQHLGVYNNYNGLRYLHDFLKGKTIAESYPEVKAKYDRRIKRFMNLINSGKKICFIFHSGVAPLSIAAIKYSTSIFYKIFPKSNVDFLILQNDLNIGDKVVYKKISNNICCVSFYSGSYEAAIKQDNADPIIDKLKFVIRALVKKSCFSGAELNSNYRNGDIVTNPTPDFNGMVSFGPYMLVLQGNHTVSIDYKLTDNYRAFVDVVCDKGRIILPKTELPHNTDKHILDFTLDKMVPDLEVRFYCEPTEKINNSFFENNKWVK